MTLNEFINDLYRYKFVAKKYFIKITGDTEIPVRNILNIDDCILYKVLVEGKTLKNSWFLSSERPLNPRLIEQFINMYIQSTDKQGECKGVCTVTLLFCDKLWEYGHP